jgi:hypothetical protein
LFVLINISFIIREFALGGYNSSNEALEKDKILLSLGERLKTSEANLAKCSEMDQKISKFEKEKETDAKRIADLEFALSAQVELHKSEVLRLEKKLDEVNENLEVEKAKHKIVEIEHNRVQRNIEELRQSKEEYFSLAMQCCDKLKSSLLKLGLFQPKKILFTVILMGISIGLKVKPKLLTRSLAVEGIFVLVLVPEGMFHFLRRLDAIM